MCDHVAELVAMQKSMIAQALCIRALRDCDYGVDEVFADGVLVDRIWQARFMRVVGNRSQISSQQMHEVFEATTAWCLRHLGRNVDGTMDAAV